MVHFNGSCKKCPIEICYISICEVIINEVIQFRCTINAVRPMLTVKLQRRTILKSYVVVLLQ